jgi:iron complex transport system ATP-binding protein
MSNRELSYQLSVVLTQRLRTELMTCQEVVETGRYPYTGRLGILAADDHAQVRAAMETVDMWDLRERDFMQISDGQRQRVLLARAICQQPQIIVLDEPTSFLDIRYQLELLQTLRDLARERGIAVIMSLHELSLAHRVADDVLCVKGETIRHYGPAAEIFRRELIEDLYDMQEGSYNPIFGSLEMKRPQGAPRLLVIAGNGTGIETYRQLQKNSIPFVTGILHENDIDYQVAQGLAADVVTEKAFMPISDANYARALKLLSHCDTVINCLREYGETNIRNRELFAQATLQGCKIATADDYTALLHTDVVT